MAQYTCITLQRCNWTVKETNNCMVYEENKEEKMLFDCAQHIWPFFFILGTYVCPQPVFRRSCNCNDIVTGS